MKIEEMGYVSIMRKRLNVDANSNACDERLEQMSPMERVRLIAGWELGDSSWADQVKEWFESQGLYLTTNPDADGVIWE